MKPLVLPDSLQAFLRDSPESGMGYQTGDVTLKNGHVVRDVVFMNPYVVEVRGQPKDTYPFGAGDIASISLTHKRWKWEWKSRAPDA